MKKSPVVLKNESIKVVIKQANFHEILNEYPNIPLSLRESERNHATPQYITLKQRQDRRKDADHDVWPQIN